MPTRYVHTNLIAKDWKRLSAFYQKVFKCRPVPPERDLSGEWIDKATGLGFLTFRYVADPEGNIVEIQNVKR